MKCAVSIWYYVIQIGKLRSTTIIKCAITHTCYVWKIKTLQTSTSVKRILRNRCFVTGQCYLSKVSTSHKTITIYISKVFKLIKLNDICIVFKCISSICYLSHLSICYNRTISPISNTNTFSFRIFKFYSIIVYRYI
jgi:hypothetical protein